MACGSGGESGLEPTLQEILSHHKMEWKALSRRCTPEVRDRVFMHLHDWQAFAYCLGLPRAVVFTIERENSTEIQRKIALYEEWVCRSGSAATYQKLAEALHVHGRRDLIEAMLWMENVVVKKVSIASAQPNWSIESQPSG